MLTHWNWQKPEWPRFVWNSGPQEEHERRFVHGGGVRLGVMRHVPQDEEVRLLVEIMGLEALTTSELEGEFLDRASVRSSIMRGLGIAKGGAPGRPSEQGIADMMVDLHRTFAEPLCHEQLHAWQGMVMAGRRDLSAGCYRQGKGAMQIVSGPVHAPKVHFEAPPSQRVPGEMNGFIAWFNETAPGSPRALPALTRAALAHLRFESIHPFEDGNGRVGRAVAEKALSQALGRPALLALSHAILARRKGYYAALERNNTGLVVDDWVRWFSDTVLEAQAYSLRLTDFIVKKTRLWEHVRGRLNGRQEKALARIFREGVEGFQGGLSAGNYMSITGAPRATATRDLRGLVAAGALFRTGERRHARYWLNLGGEAGHPPAS